MIAIPAIDLRDGCCVQLVGGSFDDERVRIADPASVAERWADAGFTRIHIVDLDAATGRGSNRHGIEALLDQRRLVAQVGGGLRDTAAVEAMFSAGAAQVVLGTRALRDREWLAAIASAWPGRVIVATDARNGTTVAEGWTATLGTPVLDTIQELQTLPLAGILVTAVDREGLLKGPDLPLMRDVVQASAHPVIASGGIASMEDLSSLGRIGVAATVIGMALYSGALDPSAVAREFTS